MWVRYGVHNNCKYVQYRVLCRRLIDCIEFNRYKQVIVLVTKDSNISQGFVGFAKTARFQIFG